MRVWDLPPNPFANLERQPQRFSGEFNVLAADEILLLAAHASDDQDAALYTVAGFTGLRLGELRALRWRDLAFADRLVHVRRSYTRGAFKTPKSGRVRSVPMIDHVIGPLDRLSRREHFTGPDDLVFCNQVGDVIDESALRRRFYRALTSSPVSSGCGCTTSGTPTARSPSGRTGSTRSRRTPATRTSR